MALTIGPVVHRAGRRKLLVAHGVGPAYGSLTMALLCTLLGALLAPVLGELSAVLPLVGAAALAAWALNTVSHWGLPAPRSRWQVPEQWRYTLPPMTTLGLYGYLLGLGGVTYMVLPTYWLLVGGTVALHSVSLSLLSWGLFALTRLTTTVWATSKVTAGAVAQHRPVSPPGLPVIRALGACLMLLAASQLVVSAA